MATRSGKPAGQGIGRRSGTTRAQTATSHAERPGVTFCWAARTDVGKLRQVNEDSFLATPGIFAIADGMGGHHSGDVASQTVVGWLDQRGDQVPIAIERLDTLISEINTEVRAVGVAANGSAMGTTLVAMFWARSDARDVLVVANIGDSRCYITDDEGFRIVTHDHSLVQELVDAGDITRVEAESHPERNVVTRAIGIDDVVAADYVVISPSSGPQRFVLCSDGVSGMLQMQDIQSIACEKADPGAAVDALIEEVLEGPAPDNATVVVVDVEWTPDAVLDDVDITGPRRQSTEKPDLPPPAVKSPLIAQVPR